VSDERDRQVRVALALVALAPCLLCEDAPAGSGVVYLPYDGRERAVVYPLCSRCHSREGWTQRAESVLYREAV
jgi:hypothetical protein